MISTGYPSTNATKTEVIVLDDSNILCEDLEDFPMEIGAGIGAKLASTSIFCGGILSYNESYYSSDKCFKYTKGGWQHFATMVQRRVNAAGIVYNNALHIFGGYDYDTFTTLQSSEIINEDGSSTLGPQLPIPIQSHAIASINSTVSILTGGYTNTSSYKTWFYNHESQQFQAGPNLLGARYDHSSGIVTDQETKEKMTIIVGYKNFNNTHLDSTEILLNGQWMTGKIIQIQRIVHFLYPL